MLIETLFELMLKLIKRSKVKKSLQFVAVAVMLVIFVITNINTLKDYKRVYELDNKYVTKIIETLPEEAYDINKTLSINYNVEELKKEKNVIQDVYSVMELDWAVQGKIQVLRNKVGTPKVYINSHADDANYVIDF